MNLNDTELNSTVYVLQMKGLSVKQNAYLNIDRIISQGVTYL